MKVPQGRIIIRFIIICVLFQTQILQGNIKRGVLVGNILEVMDL